MGLGLAGVYFVLLLSFNSKSVDKYGTQKSGGANTRDVSFKIMKIAPEGGANDRKGADFNGPLTQILSIYSSDTSQSTLKILTKSSSALRAVFRSPTVRSFK
jgi:hypothetical protein